MKKIIILIFFGVLTSCNLIDELDLVKKTRVQKELISFYNEYVEQAQTRNVNPNPYNRTFEIVSKNNLYDSNGNKVLGLQSSKSRKRHIVIQIEQGLLDSLKSGLSKDTAFIEKIIFHELGHGLLDYDHFENIIMTTGGKGYDQYKDSKKELLDEFFFTYKLNKTVAL